MAEQETPIIHDSRRIRVDLLDPASDNPQRQDGAVFGQLVTSIKEIGMAESVLVSGPFPDGKYKIVGGHHKVDAAKVVGMSEVPCVVLPPMSDDEIGIWLVRMNSIRGSLDPFAFTRLFNKLASRYDPDVLRQRMGITSETAWKKIYRDVRRSLPPEIVRRLDATKGEIKDVEGLASIIRKIFTEHGEQLQYRFLVFEYGGTTHTLLKMSERTARNLDRLQAEALEKKVDLNVYINRLLEQYLSDEGDGNDVAGVTSGVSDAPGTVPPSGNNDSAGGA